MAESVYNLEVLVSLQDKISSPLKGIASMLEYTGAQAELMQKAFKATGMASPQLQAIQKQMNAMAKMNTFKSMAADLQAAGLGDQVNTLAAGLERVAAATEKMAAGKALLTKGGLSIAAGLGLAATMYEPIKNAAELQQNMMAVRVATGANAGQIQQLTKNAMLGSLTTGVSSVMVSQLESAMSKSGLPLSSLMNPSVFSNYLKFGDLLYQRDGTPISTSASDAVSMSHEYQLYKNPAQLNSFLNQLWSTLAISKTSVQSFGNIFSYFAGSANKAGITSSNALSMEAFLIRSGLAGSGRSGGSDLMQFINHATAPSTAAAAALMKKYGLLNKQGESVFYQNGNFVGLPEQISIMQQFAKRFHGNKGALITAINTMFTATGARYAEALSGASAPSMNALLQKQQGAVPNISTAQAMQMNTINGQLSRLKQGWNDMLTGLGMPQLASVMNFLKAINATISKIVQFEIGHQALMKMAGDFIKLTSAALVFKGVTQGIVGVGKMLNGAYKLTKLFSDFSRLGSGAIVLIRDFSLLGGTMRIAGQALLILGSWIGRITGLTKVWGAVTAVTSAIMEMTPIGWIITGLAALAVAVTLVVTHWQTCVKWLQEAWTWFKNLGAGAQAAIALIMPIVGIPAMIVSHWSGIVSFFQNIWSHVSPIISAVKSGWNLVTGSGSSTASAASMVPSSSSNTTVHINVNGSGDPHTVAKHVVSLLGKQSRVDLSSNGLASNKLAIR